MRECGARDVPSFKAFRAMQAHIRNVSGVSVTASTSDIGNVFYTTDIRDLVSKVNIIDFSFNNHHIMCGPVQDFANPEVAPSLQRHPEDVVGGSISEMWQVPNGRWHELPRDKLMPSILVGMKRFYIDEVAGRKDGTWVIPVIWIEQNGEIHADCRMVDINPEVPTFLNQRQNHAQTVPSTELPICET